ncbi:ABC transporter permease [Longibacter sp.]|uniref:ABC transporter permease n=1 Tax=Longibacter sp. TaxID=2045415 RepID=UPI003EBDFFF4
MLLSYLKTALRALHNRLGLTTINVIGLSLGLAAALVIVLYAQHELTYDRFHAESDRIYQVYKERGTPTGTQISRDTWAPLLPRLQQDYPSIETGTRFFTQTEWIEREGNRLEETMAYVDSTFRDVFSFPLRHGSGEQLLSDPNAVLMTVEAAERHFGTESPVGQTITVDFNETLTVAGVLEPIPTNSTLQFDMARAIHGSPGYPDVRDNWGGSFLYTYILLNENAAPDALEAQFPDLIASIFGAEENERTTFQLQALPTLQNALSNNRQIAYILLAVALAVMLVAGINFTNLAVAQSLDRAREIGVRKALGAYRGQLAIQFLGEALLMSLGALILGTAVAASVLPAFNSLYDVDLGLHLATYPQRIAVLLGFGVLLGLATGAYPASVLAGFVPSQTLRGSHERKASGQLLRRGLVVVQFAVSMLLIVGTLAAWQQIGHLKDAPLNVAADRLLAINTDLDDFDDAEAAASRLDAFHQEVERLSTVQSASFGRHVPGRGSRSFLFIHPGTATTDDQRLRMRYAAVGDHYFETLGAEMVAGRSFSDRRASDSTAVVLNRAAAEAFGWGPDAVGKTVRIGPDRFPVIGVVEDYRYNPAREAIAPVVHLFGVSFGSKYDYLAVRTAGDDPSATVDQIQTLWQKVDPSRALPFEFVDQRFQQLYEQEENLATIAGAFTGLGIAIACLGLLGLSAVSVARRRKEIGIRKALGASVSSVAVHLGKDYLRLVALAIVLAVPVAYLGVDRWLADFAVRIDLGIGLFLGAGILALLLAAATIGIQTVRAARLNPATTLRDE